MSIFKATTALAAMLGGALMVSTPALAHHHHSHHSRHHHIALGYPSGGDRGIRSLVTRIAAEEGVPVSLAHALIKIESGYNCAAHNPSGAIGIGQLMGSTARMLGVRNPRDCVQNLRGSMRYLHMGLSRYGMNCSGVSFYNLGQGRCSAYGRKVIRLSYLG